MILNELVITTLNIQSLGQNVYGVRKRAELRNFIDKQVPKIGILLLQEHHLPLEDCMKRTQLLEYCHGHTLETSRRFF